MHTAVVGGAGPCIQQWWVGAGPCIQQWWMGLNYAYSGGRWDWTTHIAVVGGAGP